MIIYYLKHFQQIMVKHKFSEKLTKYPSTKIR